MNFEEWAARMQGPYTQAGWTYLGSFANADFTAFLDVVSPATSQLRVMRNNAEAREANLTGFVSLIPTLLFQGENLSRSSEGIVYAALDTSSHLRIPVGAQGLIMNVGYTSPASEGLGLITTSGAFLKMPQLTMNVASHPSRGGIRPGLPGPQSTGVVDPRGAGYGAPPKR